MKLYLDANCIIYAVEGADAFRRRVLARVHAVEQSPSGVILTSVLSRTESLVKPLRDQDAALLASFEQFFGASTLTLVDITKSIADVAAQLRAKYRFRTPDAIHLATAISCNADAFLTGDAQLARCAEIAIELIQ